MEAEEIPVFKEFLRKVSPVLKDANLIKLARKRYQKSNPHFLRSADFAQLLQATERKMLNDSKHRFVHFKDLLGELKAYENLNTPKHLEKYRHKRSHEVGDHDAPAHKRLALNGSVDSTSVASVGEHSKKDNHSTNISTEHRCVTDNDDPVTHKAKCDEVSAPCSSDPIKIHAKSHDASRDKSHDVSHDQSHERSTADGGESPCSQNSDVEIVQEEGPPLLPNPSAHKQATKVAIKRDNVRSVFNKVDPHVLHPLTTMGDLNAGIIPPVKGLVVKPNVPLRLASPARTVSMACIYVPHIDLTRDSSNSGTHSLPVALQRLPVAAQGLPVAAQQLPVPAQRLPVAAQRLPITAQRLPVTAQRLPVTAQRLPVAAQRLPVTSQRLPVTAQRLPVSAQQLPAPAHRMPVASQRLLVTAQSGSSSAPIFTVSGDNKGRTSKSPQLSSQSASSTQVSQGKSKADESDSDSDLEVISSTLPSDNGPFSVHKSVASSVLSCSVTDKLHTKSTHITSEEAVLKQSTSDAPSVVQVINMPNSQPVVIMRNFGQPCLVTHDGDTSVSKPSVTHDETVCGAAVITPKYDQPVVNGQVTGKAQTSDQLLREVQTRLNERGNEAEGIVGLDVVTCNESVDNKTGTSGQKDNGDRASGSERQGGDGERTSGSERQGGDGERTSGSERQGGDGERALGSERQIRRLEQLLEKTSKAIRNLEERELTLDDLDSDESSYIMEEKLKKRFVKIWEKLCKVKGRKPTTGRPVEQKFKFSGTRYKEVNHKIERFVNKKKIFPDYPDVLKIVRRTNLHSSLGLVHSHVVDLAKEAFTELGNLLQERRKKDFVMNFGSHLTERFQERDDPAWYDSELKRTLDKHKEEAKEKMNQVLTTFTNKQYEAQLKGEPDEDDDDDDDDEEEEEDREAQEDDFDLDNDLDNDQNNDLDGDHDDDLDGDHDDVLKEGDNNTVVDKKEQKSIIGTNSPEVRKTDRPSESVNRLDCDHTVSTTEGTSISTPLQPPEGKGHNSKSGGHSASLVSKMYQSASPIVGEDDNIISSSNLPVTEDSNSIVVLSDSD